MINHNGAWLPSITWGLSAIILIAVILMLMLGAGIYLWFTWVPKDPYADRMGVGLSLAFSSIGLAILTVASLAGYYPYEGDYHRLQPASGTVQAVDSRFLNTSQYVVVTFTGGQVVRCDDSRCATLKPGDTVHLLCTKEHEIGSPLSADGWSCRWGIQ